MSLLVVAVALVVVPSGGSAVELGATECGVDFRANTANLDCTVSMPGGRLGLDGTLILTTTVGGGQVATFGYDSQGRLVRADVDGGTTSYAYDEAGRLAAVVEPDGTTTPFGYDSLGRLVRAGDAAVVYSDSGVEGVLTDGGEAVDYTYDTRGNLITVTQGDSVAHFAYDSHRRVTRADAEGQTTSYDYEDGALVRRASNGEVTEYSYDRVGRLVRSSGRGETIAYDYDVDGSLVRAAGTAGTTAFAYERRGLISRISAPDGTATSFTFNTAGLPAQVAPEIGDEVIVAFIEGDPDRPLVTGMVYGDSRGDSFALTPRGRLLTCRSCP